MELLTADNLIREVREQANELNTAKPTQDAILRVLNRGQRLIQGVLAKHYIEPLLVTTNLDLTQGDTFQIPRDSYADMAEYVQINVPGFPAETRFRSYRDSTRLQSAGAVAIPFAWTIEGRNIRFLQTPSGAYSAKLWYARKLDKLTYAQGQITGVGTGYVTVDSSVFTGPDSSKLSQDSDSPNSYVNLVDARTGEVKLTLQVASIVGSKITFRSTPVRTTFHLRSVSAASALNAAPANSYTQAPAVDDLVCLAEGTCVPYFPDELATYLVEYGAAELARSTSNPEGNGPRLEQSVLDQYKQEIEAAWAGREAGDRVKNRSQQWPNTYRRWPVSGK